MKARRIHEDRTATSAPGRALISVAILALIVVAAAHARDSEPSCCAKQNPGSDADSTESDRDRTDVLVSAWLRPAERKKLSLSHPVTRHDGQQLLLSELAGKPMAVSFVYTRCTNPNKCPKVMGTIVALRRKLESLGLLEKVRLLLITYDSEWDTLDDMRAFGERFGLDFDEHTAFLRPAVDKEHRLYRDLDVTASFSSAGVVMHSTQLLLIDREGRLARTYEMLLWENDRIIEDLTRLVSED